MVVYRGLVLGSREFSRIQHVVDGLKAASYVEMAQAVCRRLGWRSADGALAITSCRLLMDRLHRRGMIRLPAPQRAAGERAARRRFGCAERALLELMPQMPCPAELSGPLDVRLIAQEEMRGWRLHMERYHYLGCPSLVGQSLRYAAFIGGELVALLAWGAAALHNPPRDERLGWDVMTKAKRLPGVVQNVRFLILPWVKLPHLASRVLGANLRRLAEDWQARFGYPVLLAETFVDVSRFRGTCYRASNWIYLGQTHGFSRRGASYQRNGQPKAVFVYPLQPHAFERLCAPLAPTEKPAQEVHDMIKLDVTRLPLDGRGGLIQVLRRLPDPRKRRGIRYSLVTVMAISVCATLAGAQSVEAIAQWASDQSKSTLRRLGSWRHKAPSANTFRRIMGEIDVVAMEREVGGWLAKQATFRDQGLAIDGKTLRGSGDGEERPFHLVSAVLHREGLVVGQVRVPDKTNEIKAVEPLLANLNIEGAVVTADAMHTQKETAAYIVEQKRADYLFTVKDNQPTLRQDIEDLHLEVSPPWAQHDR